MAKASDNAFPSILMVETAAPAAPSAGRQRLFIDPADATVKRVNSAGTVTAVGGGGSSSAWAAGVNLPLTSLTDWTNESGTWTASAAGIRQATTAVASYRLRYTGARLTAHAIAEVELNVAAMASDANWAGLALGVPQAGGGGGVGAFLQGNVGGTAIGQAYFEQDGVVGHGSLALASTLAFGAWHKIRAVIADGSVDFYVNGVLVQVARNLVAAGQRPWLSLVSRSTDVTFRNLKTWSLTLPA